MQTLTNLGIFILAYGHAFLTGSGRARMLQPERIVIIAGGKLGDIVCTTPVLRMIRTHLPQAQVFMSDPGSWRAELLAGAGLADSYFTETGFFALARALRRIRPDAVLITGPSYHDLAPALFAGVPLVVAPRVMGGFSPQYIRPYRALLPLAKTFDYHVGAYAPRERLRVLEPLGIHTDDATKHLAFSGAAEKSVRTFLADNNLAPKSYVVISPSAGNKIKEWPPERFAKVAEHLVARGVPVVVIGTRRDQVEVEAMLDALDNRGAVLSALERFSLDETKAFIAAARLFISVDTGPIYIAEAFGVPTIDITGPIDEKEQPPIGPHNVVITPPSRTRPELYVLNARVYDEAEALRQVRSISVEQVTSAVDTLLALV